MNGKTRGLSRQEKVDAMAEEIFARLVSSASTTYQYGYGKFRQQAIDAAEAFYAKEEVVPSPSVQMNKAV